MMNFATSENSTESLNYVNKKPESQPFYFDAYIQNLILELVSNIFRVSYKELLAKSRSQAHIAFARQVAMYLTHICCGMNLTQTGEVFKRDRTTVAYACSLVEDRRDDPNFDLTINFIEKAIDDTISYNQRRKNYVM